MQALIKRMKQHGKTIGFVPTMGYLHKGHLSLARQAKRDCDVSMMSIFVNPIQFSPKEDFKQYPRNLKGDKILAQSAGVDFIFYPTDKAMYPENFLTYVNVNKITDTLCGASRPGHFRGVATVVTKLFNIIQPDIAYFGQKDAQQAQVIKKMVQDLNFPLRIKVMPIVRETDGLAMSSRNRYLNPKERTGALILSWALNKAKRMIKNGVKDSCKIISVMRKIINNTDSARIEYISVVDADTLEPQKYVRRKTLIALAVWIGRTRLIDNIII